MILRSHSVTIWATLVVAVSGFAPKLFTQDCNLNGVADSVEVATCSSGEVTCADCNNNGLPDECDLAERIGFSATALSTASTRPTCVEVADYDGVNGPDLAVGALDSNEIEFFFNDGNGTFASSGSVVGGNGTVEIVSADFDGVGGMDVAAVHLLDFTASVTVAVNDGNGEFTVTESVALGNGLTALAAGDFDGQGGPDLAVVNRTSQVVTILLNVGGGGFIIHNSGVALSSGDLPARMVATDYDDDGKLDLVVSNQDDNSLSLLRNNFPATGFLAATTLALPGTDPQGLAIGNFDGVNGEDIAIANESSSDVTVLLDDNLGSGYLQRGPFFSADAPVAIASGDLNGDGKADLATANFNGSSFSVFLGIGNGTFSNTFENYPSTGLGPVYLELADLNDDGQTDIVTANRDGNNVTILLGTKLPAVSSDCQLDGVPDECQDDCTNPPFAFCANAVRLTDGGCEIEVSPAEMDTSSFDPDGTDVQLSLNPPGPYPVGTTPVELIVEDSCCQIDSCFAAVIVSDGDPPDITCPAPENFGTSFACTYIGEPQAATASDNCSVPEDITLTSDAPGVFARGQTVVTWTATDESGNSSTCTQTVFVFDDDDPFVDCPADRTLGTNLGCSYLGSIGQAAATDNCTIPSTIVIDDNAPGIFTLGETSVLWTATDEAGNSASCTQVVTIIDDDPPTISCPVNQTLEVNVGCAFVGSFGTATAEDPCSGPGEIDISNDAPLSLQPGVTTVTWTATDEAGNAASCAQSVTVLDRTAPVLQCPENVTLETNVGCTFQGTLSEPAVSDNCSSTGEIVVFNTAPSAFPLGDTTVVWVATDAAGNTAVCTQVVTVVDDDAPAIQCPEDVVVEVGADCTFVGDIGSATATDNCTEIGDIVIESDQPLAFPIGETIVTWTATDAAGNVATCTQTVSTIDVIAPVITCPGETTVSAGADCRFEGNFGTATATDNCSTAENISVTHDAPGGLPLGASTVTWTATDQSGNSTTCQQLVHVVDTTAPVITCPPEAELLTNVGCAFIGSLEGPEVTDNCSSVEAVVITDDAPTALGVGVTLVTWTATDQAGNTSSCVQVVNVVDRQLPSISCPAAVTVGTNDGCTYVGGFGSPTATDNCTAAPLIEISSDAPAALPLGDTLVTWTATDGSGNSSTCTQLVTVEDTIAPAITCPAPVTLGTNEDCGYRGSFGTPDATDNCPGEVALTNDAPDLLPLGTSVVTWTATDLVGNSTTCTQEVTIVDDDSPELTCPTARVVNTNVGCLYVGAIGEASATDNCSSPVNITIVNDAPAELPLGVTVVTWTATDEAGNQTMCSQEVTVLDDDAPTIICPDELTVGTNVGCSYEGALGAPTVSDNCSDVSAIAMRNDAPEQLPLGVNLITWTATDEAGNEASCVQTVNVLDDDAPTIACPTRAVRMTNVDCSYSGEIDAPVASDNCAAPEAITISSDAPEFFPLGMTIVTWTATDEQGNTASCTQEVLIEDDDPPVLECAEPAVFDINRGCSYFGELTSLPNAVDNCSPTEALVFSNDAPVAFPPGTTQVVWTVVDEAGNSSTCAQDVIVRDGIPPSLICPQVTLSANADGCVYSGDLVPPIATDNCSAPAGISLEHDVSGVLEVGTTEVTWVARDEDGNEVECVTEVTVADRIPPQLTCPGDLFVGCDSQNGARVEFTAEAEDECDSAPDVTFSPPSGSIFPPGVTVVFARAEDASGNATTCTFSVSVSCEPGGFQLPGDCNQDGSLDISDPVCLLGFLFLGSPDELPCGSGGADDPSNELLYRWDSERIELSSAVQALQFLFFTGSPNPFGQECVQVAECPDACAME